MVAETQKGPATHVIDATIFVKNVTRHNWSWKAQPNISLSNIERDHKFVVLFY